MTQQSRKTVRYSDIVKSLKTGDIFLFHGDSRISRIIEIATGSRFSHVGMVYRPDADRPPMLWEAGGDPIVEDPLTHSKHGGAQLGWLHCALHKMNEPRYGDEPYLRQLSMERTTLLEESVVQAVADLEGRDFPSTAKLIENWAEGKAHIVASDKTIFCAELVAMTYMRMGLLPFDPPPNWYDPKAFSAEYHRLPLLKDASLGDELHVIMS